MHTHVQVCRCLNSLAVESGLLYTCLANLPLLYTVHAKGVGPGPTLAWPGWKQPDIPVEVDTGRLETEVGRQEF
jgi:hypothetical protein